MHVRLLTASACAFVALAAAAAQPAGAVARPAVTWLRGEGNYAKAHRPPQAITCIVIHVTEGQFWGSVRWLRSRRAHASSHFVVSRSGHIVQLVHISDIAWHAGNRRINRESVGIEHEGWTYGSAGFTDAQYRQSAKLVAWLARRSLIPIDREHIIGHAEVPAPNGGRGGRGHHTDPGPHWNWSRYMQLVRHYATGQATLSVTTRLASGSLHGVVPWAAGTRGGVRRVEFVVDGRALWVDNRAPFAFAGGRGLNTTSLANGTHVLELRAYGDGTRHDVTRRTVVVGNHAFELTIAGARPWTRVKDVLSLVARAWGAQARSVVLRIDGHRAAVDNRAPFAFRWNTRTRRDGAHVLELVARSVDGRVATKRIAVVVRNGPLVKARRPAPKPPVLRIAGQSLADGQTVSGFALWRADVAGPVGKVEFRIDGALRGTDVRRPFTLGWNTALEAPGAHRLEIRAVGTKSRVTASVRVTVASA